MPYNVVSDAPSEEALDLRAALRAHVAKTGQSKAAIDRAAGLAEGVVAKILRNATYVPPEHMLEKLEATLGCTLLSPFVSREITWAQLRADQHAADVSASVISAIDWLMRKTGWNPHAKIASSREVTEWFGHTTAAAQDLAPASFASYKSRILSCFADDLGRDRGIRDVKGPVRDLYDLIGKTRSTKNYHFRSGPFLSWVDGKGISLDALDTEALEAYFRTGFKRSTSEKSRRRSISDLAALTRLLAADPIFARWKVPAVRSPFSRPEELPGEAEHRPLLLEFDECLTPWLLGERSNMGESREVFLSRLDRSTSTAEGRPRLRARPERRAARYATALSQAGFLTSKRRWSQSTIQNFRKSVRALARRLVLECGETIPSIYALCDADLVDDLLVLTEEAAGDSKCFESSYARTFIVRIRKIARGYARYSTDQLEQLKELQKAYAPQHQAKGIAPRNRAKLDQFSEQRTRVFLDLSSLLLRDLKVEVATRRRRASAQGGAVEDNDLYDARLACRVMQIVAHDLLLARAPRTANVVEARLDWVRWHDGQAILVIPAALVKGRSEGDADLVVPLGKEQSVLLRRYLNDIRNRVLKPGDEANPYLFPSPYKAGQHYAGLLNGLCRQIHRHVGVQIHPHLYRHLVGWIWLRDDPDALPLVQRLLGHKRMDTTLNYYAEIADQTAITAWQKYLPAQAKRAAQRCAEQNPSRTEARKVGRTAGVSR